MMMKKSLLIAAFLTTFSLSSIAEVKTKEVCKDVVGKNGQVVKNKDGSVKQQCKTIKVHKKLDGTKVPEKK
jgi:hypothetical protein